MSEKRYADTIKRGCKCSSGPVNHSRVQQTDTCNTCGRSRGNGRRVNMDQAFDCLVGKK